MIALTRTKSLFKVLRVSQEKLHAMRNREKCKKEPHIPHHEHTTTNEFRNNSVHTFDMKEMIT